MAVSLKRESGVPFVATILFSAALGGCAHYRATPLPEDPAHARPFRKEQFGMVLAADLLHETPIVKALFYHPLPERGIVPVMLHFENLGPRTIVFRRETIRMQLETGDRYAPVPPADVIETSEASMGWAYAGLPLVFPYLLAKPKIEAFNFELGHDYRQKSMPHFLRVAPGDSPTARVVFFRLADDAFQALHRSPVIEVPAEMEALAKGSNHEPGEDIQFHLSLN